MPDLVDVTLGFLGSPWLYVAVFLLTVLDAVLVIVPSETAVVALGALAVSTGEPRLEVLIPVAAIAAIAGDNLCYAIGRRIGLDRFRWMRHHRVRGAFAWARRSLDRRAAVVILTARFVPFGRLAVNLTAGATGFPVRRFVPLTVIAGAAWAVYNVLVGALFGALFDGQPVLAVVVSVAVAVTAGVAIDAIGTRWRSRAGGVQRDRPGWMTESTGTPGSRRDMTSTDSHETGGAHSADPASPDGGHASRDDDSGSRVDDSGSTGADATGAGSTGAGSTGAGGGAADGARGPGASGTGMTPDEARSDQLRSAPGDKPINMTDPDAEHSDDPRVRVTEKADGVTRIDWLDSAPVRPGRADRRDGAGDPVGATADDDADRPTSGDRGN